MFGDYDRSYLLEVLRPYRGFVFRRQLYTQRSVEWDHDHCDGCMATFAEHECEPNRPFYKEGWVTLLPVKHRPLNEDDAIAKFRSAGHIIVPAPKFHGFQLTWICPECFEAFREELALRVDPDHPQWQQAGL
jgi:hypothetical protein